MTSGYKPQNETLSLLLDILPHAKGYEYIAKEYLSSYAEWKPISEAISILNNPEVTTANEYLNRMEYRLRLAQHRLARRKTQNADQAFLQEQVYWYLILMTYATHEETAWDIWQSYGTVVEEGYHHWGKANKRAEELTEQTGRTHEWVRQGSRREKQLMKRRDEKGN